MKVFCIVKSDQAYSLMVYEVDPTKEYAEVPRDIVYKSNMIVREDGRIFKNRTGNIGHAANLENLRLAKALIENTLEGS